MDTCWETLFQSSRYMSSPCRVQTQHKEGCRHSTGGVQTQDREGCRHNLSVSEHAAAPQVVSVSPGPSISLSCLWVPCTHQIAVCNQQTQHLRMYITHGHMHACTHTCTCSPSKIPPIHSPKVVQSCRGAILALCCLC